jgi:prevent-host-death family protein
MDLILTTRPISEFRQNQASIMEAMESGPVVLTQHGRDAAVIMTSEYYNTIIKLLRKYQGYESMSRLLTNTEEPASWINVKEFDEGLRKRGLI